MDDSSCKIPDQDVWDCWIRRTEGGDASPHQWPEEARVPRVRLGGPRRRRRGEPARSCGAGASSPGSRPWSSASPRAAPSASATRAGRRTAGLGRERAPAPRRAGRRGPQRHHREPPRRCARELEAAGAGSRRRPTPRSSPTSSTRRCKSGAPIAGRGACAWRCARCTAPTRSRWCRDQRPGRDRRREDGVAAGPRPRRGRELRGVGRPGAPRAHARRHLPRGRRDAELTADRRRRSPTVEGNRDRAPVEDASLDAGAGGEGRLQALHAQGDPRAAARGRGHAARPRRPRDRATSHLRGLRARRRRSSRASCFSPAAPRTTRRWSASS